MKTQLIFVGVALAFAAPALAAPAGVADPYGARSIAHGRYESAEQRLTEALRKGDNRPEILLNLAAIRMQQGDRNSAETLYRTVLAQPNADMATLNGSAWSHDIARQALSDPAGLTRASW